MLGRVFGEEVLAALHEGILKGDLAGVVPLLSADTAKPYLRQAAQAVFLAACLENEAGAAALLLEGDGADANAVIDPGYVRDDVGDAEDNEAGDTVLTRAAREGRAGVVRTLVDSGKAAVNRAAPNGELPLVLAILSGGADCVEALLAADGIDTTIASSSYYDRTPLAAAASVGTADLVRRFLAVDGVAVNRADSDGYTALMEAAQLGHTGCVRALLRAAGIDANCTSDAGETALYLAACDGHRDCVRLLLAVGGIDVNQAGGSASPLLDVVDCRQGDWEGCARDLASAKGIDLNHHRDYDGGGTALHVVCLHKHAALADYLLTAGGCRFARDNAGGTALALAAGDKAVTKAFASGVDYWRRKLHGGHAWVMKEVVRTVLLVRQRVDARALLHPAPGTAAGVLPITLPHLPEEIWLAPLAFLRSADFMPSN